MKLGSLPLDLKLLDGGPGGGTTGRVAAQGEKVSKSHGGAVNFSLFPFL